MISCIDYGVINILTPNRTKVVSYNQPVNILHKFLPHLTFQDLSKPKI